MAVQDPKKPVKAGMSHPPMIMQMEALECGAACLSMILANYGRWVPLEKMRVDCGVSRDGQNAGNIVRAAKKYGLDAQGYRIDDTEVLKKEGEFPCIIHWNFNHFVVLRGFKGNYAYLNDPGRGSVRVTMKEFEDSFTGVALFFEPTAEFQTGGERKSTFGFAAKRLSGEKAAVVFVLLTMIISYLFGIINPAFTRFFMDRLLTGENRELLYPFILLLTGVGIMQVAVSMIQCIYSLKLNGKMAIAGNSAFMWKLMRMPVEFYTQRLSGDILMRKSTNGNIAQTIVQTLAPLALNAIMMVVYLVVMLRLSPLLTLIGLAGIVLNLLMNQIITKRSVNIMRVQMRDAGKLSAATVSGIQMMETIKSSGAETGYFHKWAGYQASVNAQATKYQRVNLYLGAIPSLISTLVDSFVVILGVWFCMQGRFTLGAILAFQGFLSSFMSPAMTLIDASRTIQEMRTEMERIEDVMEYPEDSHLQQEGKTGDGGEENYAKLKGNVELRNVTFGYSPLAAPLIRDFSMSLKTGQRVALVGTSGCGKSTLSKLISGLYHPWSGEILFDGKPIEEIDHAIFTGSVAVVDQEITLFEDTIANNIKMWDQSIEDFEMILAARDAQIYDTILQRPGTFQARLIDGGKDLSGGQRQRIEIARVLAQDPSIIIMDEATSALDAQTEYELVKAVVDRGITCIVIAHRLSTIRDCDEIIVMDKGQIVERGTHEELYAKGGFYTELVSND